MNRPPDLVSSLAGHWSSRAELLVHRGGLLLDRLGLPGVSHWYTERTWFLVEWLADRQRAYIRGMMR